MVITLTAEGARRVAPWSDEGAPRRLCPPGMVASKDGHMDEKQGKRDIVGAIRRLVELAMPDLRHYYRMTRKARVAAVYASDGEYFCDVQPLRNDESADPKEPLVPRVALPVLWGGPDRGVVWPARDGRAV